MKNIHIESLSCVAKVETEFSTLPDDWAVWADVLSLFIAIFIGSFYALSKNSHGGRTQALESTKHGSKFWPVMLLLFYLNKTFFFLRAV